MADDSRSRLKLIEARAVAKLKDEVDFALLEFKKMFEELNAGEKSRLKNWLRDALVLRQGAESMRPRTVIQLQFSHEVDEDEITVRMSAVVAADAIAAWNRGESYTPRTLQEFFG